ncbi:MAG: Crp/Fnr family transcriptional regulator [Bacteroidota bacterium]
MDTSLFYKHFLEYVDFPEEDFNEFSKLLVPFILKKNEIFYRAGEIPKYSPFILKGCVRQYITNENGEEQNILFVEEGTWSGQIGSMRNKVPTNVTMQALEDCEILGMTIENADYAMEKFPAYGKYFIKKYPADHARLLEQSNRLKTETPELLYTDLMKERPSLILRVPQHHIANYLGVRTETISRIRNKIAKG